MTAEGVLDKTHDIPASMVGTEIALKGRQRLFNDAEGNIKIVNSELPSNDVISKAFDRGVAVEIITGPDHPSLKLAELVQQGVTVYELGKPPTESFDIVDNKHFRFETLGIEESPGRQEILRDAQRYLCNDLLLRYSSLKAGATKY